jgi:2-polyprenyl-6-methoxyphenol hydroxylase-like FAD-dependent oxidoreductase
MSKGRALIAGGSLGGLLAANMLRSVGWDVEVFERAGDDLASRGAGIGVHEEMLVVLRRIGVIVDDSLGVVPKSRICLEPSGKLLLEFERPSVLSSWGRLYRALKDALPPEAYHFGKSLAHYEANATGVTAVFSDGSRASGDLLIGADGLRSTVRQQLMPEVQPRYAGYVAWRGLLLESAMPPDLHREIFERSVVCLPEGEMFAGYPVPGPDNDVRPGHRGYNLVWYHPVEGTRELQDLCTDASGHCHGSSIPPPLIRTEITTRMRKIAREVLAPQCAQVVELIPQLFFQAIFDLAPPRMVDGRVVLLGDAAFVARPHAGMGVTKAAFDAECLADSLAAHADIAAALHQYNELQHAFGTRLVARARRIGAHLEAQGKPRELRTPEELHQNPAVFMRESGARLKDIPELMELIKARRGLAASPASLQMSALPR